MSNQNLTAYEEMKLEDARGLRHEELVLEVTEAFAKALEVSGITQSQLAARLGKPTGYVSQLMGGGRNLTLRTMADVAGAMGCRVRVQVCTAEPRPDINVRAKLKEPPKGDS